MVAGEIAGECDGTHYWCVCHPGSRNSPPHFLIRLNCLSDGEFCVVREGPAAAFFKKIGLDQEIQTRDSAFDTKYFVLTNHAEFASACFSEAAGREAVGSILDSGFTEVRHDGKTLSAKWRNFQFSGAMNPETVQRTVRSLAVLSGNIQMATLRAKPVEFPRWRLARGALLAVASVLAAAGFVLTIITAVSYPPLRSAELWRMSLSLSALLLPAFLFLSVWLLRGRSYSHRDLGFVAALSLFGVPMFLYGFEGVLNGSQDKQPPTDYAVEVVKKYTTHSRRSTTYHVHVASWRPDEETESLTVSRRLYGQVTPGQSRLSVLTGPGALKCEWVRSVALLDQGTARESYATALFGVPLTVERVFQSMGVARIPFTRAPEMDDAENDFFGVLFDRIDAAIVARVLAMSLIEHNRNADESILEYLRAAEAIRGYDVPPRLQPVRDLVFQAMQEQGDFLQQWNYSPELGNNLQFGRNPLVHEASKKLRQAYQQLLELYSTQTQRTKEVFHSELCALDFI